MGYWHYALHKELAAAGSERPWCEVIGDPTDAAPFSIAASISPGTACDGPDRDQPQRIDPNLAYRRKTNRQQNALKWATSSRNSERLEMTGRHHRNQQVKM